MLNMATEPQRMYTDLHSSLALTSTEDDDSFKSKFENLKILVKHLQKELALQRLRADGLQSITNCLEEERQENVLLRDRVLSLKEQNNHLLQKGHPNPAETIQNKGPDHSNPLSKEPLPKTQILEGQLAKVNAQLVEVTQMNSRWQQYNQQREEYVQQLLQQISGLEIKLNEMKSVLQVKDKETSDITHTAQVLERKHEILKVENRKIEDENKMLLKKVVYLQEHLSHMERDNRHLQMHLEKAKNTAPTDYKEKIEMLEAQIRICTEDFESERRDRERAISKYAELEKHVNDLMAEKDMLQRQLMSRSNQRRQQALHEYQMNYQRAQSPMRVGLVGHGLYQNDCVEDGSAEGFDTIDDSLVEDASSAAQDTVTESIKAENKLQCPKCGREFPVQQHTELLEHIDECCE